MKTIIKHNRQFHKAPFLVLFLFFLNCLSLLLFYLSFTHSSNLLQPHALELYSLPSFSFDFKFDESALLLNTLSDYFFNQHITIQIYGSELSLFLSELEKKGSSQNFQRLTEEEFDERISKRKRVHKMNAHWQALQFCEAAWNFLSEINLALEKVDGVMSHRESPSQNSL